MNSFEQSINGVYNDLLGYLRQAHDPTDAEDILHRTLTKAWISRDTFVDHNFKAWIYTIARHEAANFYRSEKKHRQSESRIRTAGVEPSSWMGDPDPDTRVDRRILEAIDELPEEFRETICLRELSGLTYPEISEKLDIPVGTVMSRLYRGRRILREQLEDLAHEAGIL